MLLYLLLKLQSDEQKGSVKNRSHETDETAKHCRGDHSFSWNQKEVVDREYRLIPRNIKEAIHSLKNPNHINIIFLRAF